MGPTFWMILPLVFFGNSITSATTRGVFFPPDLQTPSGPSGQGRTTVNPCKDSEGRDGLCVEIRECPQVRETLAKRRPKICGWSVDDGARRPFICCSTEISGAEIAVAPAVDAFGKNGPDSIVTTTVGSVTSLSTSATTVSTTITTITTTTTLSFTGDVDKSNELDSDDASDAISASLTPPGPPPPPPPPPSVDLNATTVEANRNSSLQSGEDLDRLFAQVLEQSLLNDLASPATSPSADAISAAVNAPLTPPPPPPLLPRPDPQHESGVEGHDEVDLVQAPVGDLRNEFDLSKLTVTTGSSTNSTML